MIENFSNVISSVFSSVNFLYFYICANILFFIMAVFYRIKYFDMAKNEYKKELEENKPATIMLATFKTLIMIEIVAALMIIIFMHLLARLKIKFLYNLAKTKVGKLLFSVAIQVIGALFLTLPLTVLYSILGLIGNYRIETLNIEKFYKNIDKINKDSE